MKYSLVIFDLDGTILNTLDDLAICCNYVLEKNGFPLHSKDEVRFMVGNGIPNLIKKALPKDTDEKTCQKVLQEFLDYYNQHASDNTKPYEKIEECLLKLKQKGIKLAVNTNKAQQAAATLCEHFFPSIFDYVVGQCKERNIKPSCDGVNYILQMANTKNAIYVGDSDVDIQTAHNANIDVIGAEWGFRGKEFLLINGATKTAKDAEQLYKLLTE